MSQATTLRELKADNYKVLPVREEMRLNLIRKLQTKETLFPGIIGYQDTVVPQIVNAVLSGQDIIMLGEMRDLETTSAAITAAETGHLVLGTLHTTGAARTVDRIIDQFPREQQEQVRTQLSVSLQAVVSQVLLPRADGTGRVAAFEVMVRNSAIENHIRKGETFKVPSVMQTQKRIGMQLLDDHLLELVNNGTISRESALSSAQIPSDLAVRLDGENPS